MLCHVHICATPWTAARQASLSMEFSRQVYWSGLPFPTPGDLPDTGIGPVSLSSLALADGLFTTVPHGNPMTNIDNVLKKQRHHFASKGPHNHSYGFSNSHV